MKEKYYYQLGRCECNHYLSHNPIIYTQSSSDEHTYSKVRMDCQCIINGECDRTYTCQLLMDAPDVLISDGVNLRDKKLG